MAQCLDLVRIFCYTVGMKKKNNSFEIFDGYGAVMLSAPHNVEHLRNGQMRFAEPQTGVLALKLHDELHVPVIVKTFNDNDDANFDEVSPYKQSLAQYINAHGNIRLLIDLHQLAPERDIAADIGTADKVNFADDNFVAQIVSEFESRNITPVKVDFIFKGAGQNTVSSFIRVNCGIPTLQLELNSNLLVEKYPAYNPDGVYDALKSIITFYNRQEGANE